ncbi:hypothetical protein K469DRAFT_179269 [Zopfia rhizophila CBS 207.26]|uniref:Uncharacterized protein n=1 Tax=Zopfia rhizophila CBS 207.26 TaxID=1314779 RepID=A0A6A6E2C7_9PEZI|nr:hypothetical protein K469DRAFT_179269 [Zopfia rhizophila CBS 207.26]
MAPRWPGDPVVCRRDPSLGSTRCSTERRHNRRPLSADSRSCTTRRLQPYPHRATPPAPSSGSRRKRPQLHEARSSSPSYGAVTPSLHATPSVVLALPHSGLRDALRSGGITADLSRRMQDHASRGGFTFTFTKVPPTPSSRSGGKRCRLHEVCSSSPPHFQETGPSRADPPHEARPLGTKPP